MHLDARKALLLVRLLQLLFLSVLRDLRVELIQERLLANGVQRVAICENRAEEKRRLGNRRFGWKIPKVFGDLSR